MRSHKKGEGCKNLRFIRTPAVYGSGHNKANHRCCTERAGIFLKQWRCVGKESPDCPGFVPEEDENDRLARESHDRYWASEARNSNNIEGGNAND